MTMTLVSTVTVGSGGAASIDFTSIPQTGTDLLILFSAQSTNINEGRIRFNTEADDSNYSWKYLNGNGSSPYSFGSANNYFTTISRSAQGTFSNNTIYIPNYASIGVKTLSVDGVQENNATGSYQNILAGKWNGTAAITTVKLLVDGSQNLNQYSSASLYLITKGSGGASVA